MSKNHELGKLGEDIAANYIIGLGYKIIERNFECKQGEIDIIAKDKYEIIFIEVKTRSSILYGKACEAITTFKKKHLINSIKYYIYANKIECKNMRIDVIEVYFNKFDIKINHIKKAID